MTDNMESSIGILGGELYVSVDLLGFENGFLICSNDGIPMHIDEIGCYVTTTVAIDMLVRETNCRKCSQAERNLFLMNVRDFHRWKDEFDSGSTSFRRSDDFVISYERYWASRTGHREQAKVLRVIRTSRPDLFQTRTRQTRPIETLPDNSQVYFLQAKTTKDIKIGRAREPFVRTKCLQTGSPDELVLLKTVKGGRQLETELHRRFKAFNVRGEWFKPEPELLNFIETLS